MSDHDEPSTSTSKWNCSVAGWATSKARDARRSAQCYEGKVAVNNPWYTLEWSMGGHF